MEIGEYVKATGSYLKADDIKKNPAMPFIITSEGTLVKSEKFQTERVHIEGEFNKESKILDASKTNARIISEKLGTTDTKKWIGHQLILGTYQTMTSDRKLVDAVIVKEVK